VVSVLRPDFARGLNLNLKRTGVAVLLVAGLAWPISGCGKDSVVPRASGSGSSSNSGLTLADSVTGVHFRLTVANGAPTLTEIGASGTVSSNPELIDSITGARFSLVVTSGALTLVPG